MFHGFLARSRASIRSAAENCYRWNSLPPLNNLNQAETRSAASRPGAFCRKMLLLCKKHLHRGNSLAPVLFHLPRIPKERHACACLFLEQGTGVEPALTAWEAAVIPIYQPCDWMEYIIFFVSFQGEIFMLSLILSYSLPNEERSSAMKRMFPMILLFALLFVRARARRRAHARRPLRAAHGKADRHGALCQG